MIDLITR